MNDTFALFSLLSHPGVSPPIARQLIQFLGSAEAVLQERDKTTKPPDGVRDSYGKNSRPRTFERKQRKRGQKSKRKRCHLLTIGKMIFLCFSIILTTVLCFCFIEANTFLGLIKSFPCRNAKTDQRCACIYQNYRWKYTACKSHYYFWACWRNWCWCASSGAWC